MIKRNTNRVIVDHINSISYSLYKAKYYNDVFLEIQNGFNKANSLFNLTKLVGSEIANNIFALNDPAIITQELKNIGFFANSYYDYPNS